MTQKFGKIDTEKLFNDIFKLENELFSETNEEIIIKKLDILFSYNKILKYISYPFEKFEKRYSLYSEYIEKLSNKTDEIYASMAKYIKQNKIFVRMFSKRINKIQSNTNLLEKKFDLKEITINDMLDISREVFDPDFIDFMFKELRSKKVHFNTCGSPNTIRRDYNGVSIDVGNDKYYIIEKDKKFYYYNLFSLIHEIFHGYIDQKYNKDFIDSPFRETYSIFNELILCKYLYENKIAYNDCKLCDTFFLEALFENCNSLYLWSYLIDSVQDNGIIDDDIFKKIIQKEKTFLEKILNNDIDDDDYFGTFIYSLGRTTAIEQYYKYIVDPEKAKYLFDKLLSNNLNTPLYEQLDTLEINKKKFY